MSINFNCLQAAIRFEHRLTNEEVNKKATNSRIKKSSRKDPLDLRR